MTSASWEPILPTRAFPPTTIFLRSAAMWPQSKESHLVTNMFGWFGSSGSGVFDNHGRYMGCVSGIDVGTIGFGQRIPLESIVWVAPVSMLDLELMKIRILYRGYPQTVLNSFPGAAAPRRGGPTGLIS